MKRLMKFILFVGLLSSQFVFALDSGEVYIKIAVADSDLNTDSNTKQTVEVLVTSDNGEVEKVLLTESGNNTARFTNTIAVLKTDKKGIDNDGKFYLNKTSNLKVVYVDNHYGKSGEKKELESSVLVKLDGDIEDNEESVEDASTGGGCSVNPNATHFDMMFFIMFILTMLYPFRKRLI